MEKRIEKIYNQLGNEYSKELYLNRLLYSLTGDTQFIKNIISSTYEGKEFLTKLYNSDKRKLIFGAGAWGKDIINSYPDVVFEGFIDNKIAIGEPDGNYLGYPVLSFDKYLREYSKDTVVIISSRLYYKPIYEQMKTAGISDGMIINVGEMIDNMSIRQYFDLLEMNDHRKERECFVDAGAFDGRTSALFVNWCKNTEKTKNIMIYAFEPDEDNAEKCNKTLVNTAGCEGFHQVISKGLWNKKEILCFQASANGSSRVIENGETKVSVDQLDNLLPANEEVTFIKMDVEGSEYNALLGAQNTIKRCKPKLAISLYHKPEDVWELPFLILEMNSEYKFYLKHYSTAAAETVLYAL